MNPQGTRTAFAARLAELACLTVAAVLLLLAVTPAAQASSGSLAWQRSVVGPSNGAASFAALAAAPAGGVFAAGGVFEPNSDFLTARYTATGKRGWLRTLDFSQHIFDSVRGAASDRRGNVIVAGQVNYPSASQVMAVVKYGPGGKREWTRFYDDSIAGQGNELVTDASGNVYVTTHTASDDIVLIKYSSAGARRWVHTYAQPGDDQPIVIAVDAAGNVYLTGFSFNVTSQYDIVTFKYAPNGHRDWVRRWNGPGGGDDLGYGIAVTRAGVVYVAGQSTGTSTEQTRSCSSTARRAPSSGPARSLAWVRSTPRSAPSPCSATATWRPRATRRSAPRSRTCWWRGSADRPQLASQL